MNMVGGMVCTFSGLVLIQKSDPIGTLRRWWNGDSATSKKVSGLALAALGLSLTSYGVYSIASALFDVLAPSPERQEKLCQKRLFSAKESIMECPEAKALWDEVAKKAPFTIKCDTFEETPELRKFGASVNFDTRQIRIYTNYRDVVRGIIFELANLKTI